MYANKYIEILAFNAFYILFFFRVLIAKPVDSKDGVDISKVIPAEPGLLKLKFHQSIKFILILRARL